MIVRNLAAANDQVMRKNAADRFVETAADGLVRHLERREGRGPTGVHFGHRFLDEVKAQAAA